MIREHTRHLISSANDVHALGLWQCTIRATHVPSYAIALSTSSQQLLITPNHIQKVDRVQTGFAEFFFFFFFYIGSIFML